MGSRGPRPQPTALSLLKGTYRRDRGATHQAQPVAVLPLCPPQLDDDAKKEWRRVGKELLACGLVSKIDRAALAGYCQAWSDWVGALEKLKAEPKVFKSPSGYPVLSPWISVAYKALDQMWAFASEFGMSPSTRSRVESLPVPSSGDRARDAKKKLLFGEGNGKLAKYFSGHEADEEEKERRYFGDT